MSFIYHLQKIGIFSIDSFEHPYFLLFLLMIPIFILCVYIKPEYFFRTLSVPSLGANARKAHPWQLRHNKTSLRFYAGMASIICFGIGFIFLTIALAHPYGPELSETRSRGIDIYFALDMSASMKAYDYPIDTLRERYEADQFTPNRFDTARATLREFVEGRAKRCYEPSKGQARCDRIGITLFAQNAFIAMPLTTNYALIDAQLERRKINDINASQTAIGDGIMKSVASLRHSDSPSRAIILVTDGDRKGGRISLEQAIAAANAYGVRIFPILIGKGNKAVMAQRDVGNILNFYEAEFPIHFEVLENIAQKTHGLALKAADEATFKQRLDDILSTLEPTIAVESRAEQRVDLSPHALLIAIVFMLFSAILFFSVVRLNP